ncbi:MAG: hypothetical protein U9Q82_11705 [Chloroflexota bacterium]|nr:hypothetical protein [Chloroflexota bacterium]
MKRQNLVLVFLVLVGAILACQQLNPSTPTPYPTQTPYPTYTPQAELQAQAQAFPFALTLKTYPETDAGLIDACEGAQGECVSHTFNFTFEE